MSLHLGEQTVLLKGSMLRNTGAWSEISMLPIVEDTAEELTEFEIRKKSNLYSVP